MHTKRIWANMAVADLQRTTDFYTRLGFKPAGRPNDQLTSFIFGDNEFIINFFIKDSLRMALMGELTDTAQSNEIIFTISAPSQADAESWAHEVQQAGGMLISQPQEFGPGFYGFVFSDPDGHRYNVFYMEGM